MAKVITTELQHSGASGANITLDSSKNVTCENNLTVDGTSTLTGAVTLPNNTITNAMMADDAIGLAELSATGSASSDKFLCGNNSWAEPGGGGKIIKVWHGSSDTTLNTNSTSFVKAQHIDITPTSASNKIHVTVKYNMHFRNHQNNQKSDSFYTKLVRTSAHDDSTSATDGSNAMGGVWTNNDNGPEYALGMGILSWMDTPNTTGNLRYALYVKVTDADWTLYLDYATGDSGTTQHDMIAYEIADVATG
tara:strand:- start:251 stop:1000 length:750 start_codon:yes stop_codon:yes gene_type:complete